MIRYQWSALRQAQVLRFYEHYVQMTLAMHDLEVYTHRKAHAAPRC